MFQSWPEYCWLSHTWGLIISNKTLCPSRSKFGYIDKAHSAHIKSITINIQSKWVILTPRTQMGTGWGAVTYPRQGIYTKAQFTGVYESSWQAFRLNLQHFLYKDAQGFLLHPVIQAELRKKQATESEESLSIADLATGTGSVTCCSVRPVMSSLTQAHRLWIFDLVKSPEVSGLNIKYHGFDISRALFPHNSWLPKNIVLSTSNLLEEPPQSLHGQFDVVHIRLVLSLIRSGSPKPVIQHIKMLLSLSFLAYIFSNLRARLN